MEKSKLQDELEVTSLCEQESPMVSATVGRAMATLLAARSRKLADSISRLSSRSSKTVSSLLGSLEDSLWFVHQYAKDATARGDNLDEFLIPVVQHCLRIKGSKHGGQDMILINWLFEDEFLFQAVAKNLANVIIRKDDRYMALGWCILVRGIVKYESSAVNQYTLNGIKNNYSALLEVLCSCIPRLLCLMCSGSTLQDGFELPSRLSVFAADCILAVTEALTKKTKVLSNMQESLNSNTSNRPISLVPAGMGEKKVKLTSKSLEVPNIEMAYLLWNQIEELNSLLQRLFAWSRKSRPLHAKGVEQVLRWLQDVKGQYGCVPDEAGGNILKHRALLLSSCWKHYSYLLHLEDNKFSQHCNELLNQYLSGIQSYTDNHAEGDTSNKDGGVETRKFFLNCLCLLLGRFQNTKFESVVSEYGMQMTHVLLSQLHCGNEDVIAGAVCIFKAVIFKLNDSSESDLKDNRQMDTVLPVLLHLLDERDGMARAVAMLIAEYCSISTDSHCLKQVLKRLASGNALQRRNAIDVISELYHISSDSVNGLGHLAWHDISNQLLERLTDEEIEIREHASNLLSMTDPSLTLAALVNLIYSSDEGVSSSASAAFVAMLKYHNKKPEVICMLLDCVSNLCESLDFSKTTRDVMEGPKVDADRVFKLIPEWSKSVQDWSSLIVPLIDKMFAEPANAIIVRFLSCISEYLAEAANIVLYHVLKKMKKQKESESFLFSLDSTSFSNEESIKMQQSLFDRLCPLLVIRLLPLRVFNDLNLSIMYDQLPTKGIYQEISEGGDIKTIGHECVATFILKRAFTKYEFEDVRKLAAELCGRIHPEVLFPIVSSLLEHAAVCRDTQKIKACLFSVCTSLVVRGTDSISQPVILEIRKTLETVLMWPSLDGDDVSKAQHGCIDCLALLICAEMQAFGSSKDSSMKIRDSGNSALTFVINHLINDENEVIITSMCRENQAFEVKTHHSFRLCMANVLISTCQKISDSAKERFARRTLPQLIHSVEVIRHPEIRAACIHVLFSAMYHLKSAVLPYSSDMLKLSLQFLRKGSDEERIAGAKLMASLMASDDAILERISGGLLEARSVLLNISSSDPSHDLQEVCQKLLACITS